MISRPGRRCRHLWCSWQSESFRVYSYTCSEFSYKQEQMCSLPVADIAECICFATSCAMSNTLAARLASTLASYAALWHFSSIDFLSATVIASRNERCTLSQLPVLSALQISMSVSNSGRPLLAYISAFLQILLH